MKVLIYILLAMLTTQDSNSILYDFTQSKNANDWQIVNDGVMGGLSKGQLTLNNSGNGVFEGFVTTKNNGGFTSIRHASGKKDVSNYSTINLKLKGDGKTYQFRIKESELQEFSYIKSFVTNGEWQTITIPFKDFYPSYRGNKLDKQNYNGQLLEEITFLIGNAKDESFLLEIKKIFVK